MSGPDSLSKQQSSDGEQSVAATTVAPDATINADAPIGFFAIGVAVNLVLIIAYIVWAVRNWKRSGANRKS